MHASLRFSLALQPNIISGKMFEQTKKIGYLELHTRYTLGQECEKDNLQV